MKVKDYPLMLLLFIAVVVLVTLADLFFIFVIKIERLPLCCYCLLFWLLLLVVACRRRRCCCCLFGWLVFVWAFLLRMKIFNKGNVFFTMVFWIFSKFVDSIFWDYSCFKKGIIGWNLKVLKFSAKFVNFQKQDLTLMLSKMAYWHVGLKFCKSRL